MDALAETPAHRALAGVLNDLLADQMEVNRRAALRADGIRDAIDYALGHPYVYTPLEGAVGAHAAELAVMLDISLRLQLSENRIRSDAAVARSARQHLARLWRRAREGFAPFALVEATTDAIVRLLPGQDAGAEARRLAAEAVALVDEATSEWVLTLPPAAFRRRLRILLDRLDPRDASTRHRDAFAERRVVVEEDQDGMSWFAVLMTTADALAARRRLTATAKHVQKTERGGRDRDQLRADLASAWLRGVGTPTAVQTKVFVTVPIGVMEGRTADEHGRCTMCGGSGLAEQARVVGGDAIDPLTASQLFLDAKSFRRVIHDPACGVIVDLDRRRRRPTTAQREWLVLQHGTCSRDGCTRLALDADIDHITEWSRGGATDLRSLRPLCPADHARRHSTALRFRSRPNGTVQVLTPTGFTSDEPPPF